MLGAPLGVLGDVAPVDGRGRCGRGGRGGRGGRDRVADDLHSVAIYDSTSTIQGVTGTDRTVLVDELDAAGKVRAAHLMAYDQETADARLSG